MMSNDRRLRGGRNQQFVNSSSDVTRGRFRGNGRGGRDTVQVYRPPKDREVHFANRQEQRALLRGRGRRGVVNSRFRKDNTNREAAKFDVGDENANIPEDKETYVPENIKPFITEFLDQFYKIYDADRQQLLTAYHENAVFSLSIFRQDSKHKYPPEFMRANRNLLRQGSTRDNLLKQGKGNVVRFLAELPSSDHWVDSFKVDIPFQLDTLVMIVVNGIFLEAGKKGPQQTRTFTRTFTITAEGTGFVIVNDQLLIGNSTFMQREKLKSSKSKALKAHVERIMAPAIGFDVGENSVILPAVQDKYIPETLSQFVTGFLEQFYVLYDSQDRKPLAAAYHEHAVFSYSISRLDVKNASFSSVLLHESRNLYKVSSNSREKLLRQGKACVVAFLEGLPSTEHKPESFSIDVPFSSEALVIVIVNGVFLETVKKMPKQLRYFCRSFTIVPQGAGFVVINDQLMVGHSSDTQRKKFNSMSKSSSYSTLQTSLATSAAMTPDKDAICAAFSQQTRMTPTFARQCLQENNYDMGEALRVFAELSSRGAIPAEAFVS
ncbi:Nuclear RNA export factor 1 [Halotydeus destructor]|nr:Nuclear RNA export factor 1 [Halotydeus destructor]